jgi:hypothetical protein
MRCYITANIHFPNSCSDAFSTCFETSTLKIISKSILQCCISLVIFTIFLGARTHSLFEVAQTIIFLHSVDSFVHTDEMSQFLTLRGFDMVDLID